MLVVWYYAGNNKVVRCCSSVGVVVGLFVVLWTVWYVVGWVVDRVKGWEVRKRFRELYPMRNPHFMIEF